MIGRVVRGWRAYGLIGYLFGPGRANEHVNPRVVGSWDGMPDRLQPPVAGVGAGGRPRFDVGDLVAALTLPAQLAGIPPREPPERADGSRPRGPVWHCSVRTAPGDRELSDTEWAQIAADVLQRTGIAARGDSSGCRWVAVRHAADHIHIAAVLVRADTGRRFHPRNDYRRLREACLAAEQRYGLTPTSPADGSATPATTRAEREKAARTGRPVMREHLRDLAREAAVNSTDLASFVRQLTAYGQVEIEVRTSPDGRRLAGYKLTDRRPAGAPAERVWFSGATLAPDLSGPALQHRWDLWATRRPRTTATRPTGDPEPVARPQQRQIIATAEEITSRTRVAFGATTALTTAGLTEPGGTDYDTELGVLPAAVADVLDRLGRLDHTHTLNTAADAFRLAAGRPPIPAAVGQSRWAPLARDLRLAARDLAHVTRLTRSPSHAVAATALLLAVAGLVAEIAAWREQRGQLAAAAAARRAHTTLTQHRLITHPLQPPAPARSPAAAPASPITEKPDRASHRPNPLLDRPHIPRPPHPQLGRGRSR